VHLVRVVFNIVIEDARNQKPERGNSLAPGGIQSQFAVSPTVNVGDTARHASRQQWRLAPQTEPQVDFWKTSENVCHSAFDLCAQNYVCAKH
jgi:hypothetical protein